MACLIFNDKTHRGYKIESNFDVYIILKCTPVTQKQANVAKKAKVTITHKRALLIIFRTVKTTCRAEVFGFPVQIFTRMLTNLAEEEKKENHCNLEQILHNISARKDSLSLLTKISEKLVGI